MSTLTRKPVDSDALEAATMAIAKNVKNTYATRAELESVAKANPEVSKVYTLDDLSIVGGLAMNLDDFKKDSIDINKDIFDGVEILCGEKMYADNISIGDIFLTTNSECNDYYVSEFVDVENGDNTIHYIRLCSIKKDSEPVVYCQPITYAELKALRDAGELVAGCQYRITDYECIANCEGREFRTKNNSFDIIVTADDDHTINENARAALHHFTEEELTADPTIDPDYFANAALQSWELKYSLDNDSKRFEWAADENAGGGVGFEIDGIRLLFQPVGAIEVEGETKYQWQADVMGTTFTGLTDTEEVEIGTMMHVDLLQQDMPITIIAEAASISGKGVVWYMKDNKQNEAYYDFKNIQYKRYKITAVEGDGLIDLIGSYNGIKDLEAYTIDEDDFVWCYTFSMEGDSDLLDSSLSSPMCLGNEIGFNRSEATLALALNNTVFIGQVEIANKLGKFNSLNTFGDNCGFNTFGNNCGRNTFGNNCYDNSFGNNCGRNTFGNGCYRNHFGNNCGRNTFGNSCYDNSFGNSCYDNSFGNDCYGNTFGNNCGRNTFGNSCYDNSFGNNCYDNSFGNYCIYISMNKECVRYYYITIYSGCRYLNIASESSSYIENVVIYSGVCGNNDSYLKDITIPSSRGTLVEVKPASNTLLEV